VLKKIKNNPEGFGVSAQLRKYILSLLVLAISDVQAEVFCVSTGNNLNIAMNSARINGQDDEIKVTTGTHITDYHAPEGPQWNQTQFGASEDEGDKDLTISGGWSTGNNCATQTMNPSATVLDARLWGPVFSLQLGFDADTPFAGNFTLSNMTLNRGKGFSPGQTTGVDVYGFLAAPASVVLDNLHAVNGQSTFGLTQAININLGGSGSIRLRNSIISLNSLSGATSFPVLVRPLHNVSAFVSNNSIFANSGTDTAAGLKVVGIATVSNNAVADNTSSANPDYEFYSDAPSALTLVKNHFATKSFANGTPFSETDTTTGNAFWAPLGVERIPLEASALRDSGDNTPAGGALAIDFRGNPRVVNTTIDRGASEAPASTDPAQGPIVVDNTPVKGSTTWLFGEPGETAFGEITFSVSGGEAGGLTLIECQVTNGTVLIGAYPSQWVATGQSAEPVLIGFDNVSDTVQTGVILCLFTRSGLAGSSFAAYTFKGALQTIFEDGFENP
jgi:hypothetical protein